MAKNDLIDVRIISSSSTSRITGGSFSPMFHLPCMAQRQNDRECGSSIAALNFNLTLMLLDYFVADRESQPGDDAYPLGGKARIEDLRQILLRDSNAGIRDCDSYGVPLFTGLD